jgi:RHS repeat-associated protein
MCHDVAGHWQKGKFCGTLSALRRYQVIYSKVRRLRLLIYFLARYYSSAQGRFTSADEPLVGQYEDDPQSWNLYAYGRNNPPLYVDPTGNDYRVYGKDGNFIGQVKDVTELKGYKLTRSDKEGRILYFEGGFRAEYFEGDQGKPAQAKDDSGMTPLAKGVFLELDRRAAASLKLIDIAADITLTPISIISGTAVFRGGIQTLGFLGPLKQPAGA